LRHRHRDVQEWRVEDFVSGIGGRRCGQLTLVFC
jgi:hypothetical protein